MEDTKIGRKEKHTTTNTTSAVDVIVKDLMEDILGKLPLRKLVRLRCVCKAWNNSIPRIAKSIHGPPKIIVTPDDFDPYTCIKIVDHEAAVAASSNTETYTDSESESEEIIQQIKLPDLKARGKVVGSCNGLLLIEFERRRNRFVLWNPLINELNILPDLTPSKRMVDFSSMIGFGHDGCSDDYKVVRIFAYEDSSFEVLVYSLKKNSWGYPRLPQPFSDNTIYEFLKYAPSMGTPVKGALYWLVTDFDHSEQSSDDDSDWFDDHFYGGDGWSHTLRFQILRFHLADGKLSWMQAPFDVYTHCSLGLMVFEGNKLCAYQNVPNYGIRMWVLKEDEEIEEDEETKKDEETEHDEVWTELMNIPIDQGREWPDINFAPLAFMRDGRVLLSRNEISEIKDCCLYNPKDDPNGVHIKKYKKELGIEGWCYEQITYEESIESLVRYDGIQRAINGEKTEYL